MFPHTSSKSKSYCLSAANFQNNASPISCWHPVGEDEKKKKKSTQKQQIPTIISPNESITIILTAIQLFHISVLRGNALSLSYPSPLSSACQPASQAEHGRRNSGRNEIDDNKAEDGETAVTERDGAKQSAWPEMKRCHFSWASTRKLWI